MPPITLGGGHGPRAMLPENFISDLEKAIATRSADAGALLHEITVRFMSPAPYSGEQLDRCGGE